MNPSTFFIIAISFFFAFLAVIFTLSGQMIESEKKALDHCYFIYNINGINILSSEKPHTSGKSNIYVVNSIDGKEYFTTNKPQKICDYRIRKSL